MLVRSKLPLGAEGQCNYMATLAPFISLSYNGVTVDQNRKIPGSGPSHVKLLL